MEKPKTSCKMIKWDIKIGEFDMEYRPRTTVKAQALADFLQEMMHPEAELGAWLLHVDGYYSAKPSVGPGIVLTNPKGEDLEVAVRFGFRVSNNEAEYEALVRGMCVAVNLGVKSLRAYSDSMLTSGQWRFQGKRRENGKICEYSGRIGQTVHFITLAFWGRDVLVLNEGADWRNDILNYLAKSILPEEKERHLIQARALGYYLIGGVLYKRAFSQPFLKCLSKEEGAYVLHELHEGACGSHGGSRLLAQKARRAGYFWPGLKEDAQKVVKTCEKCQKHGPLIHKPAELLGVMSSPYPFAKWGIDIVGPFLMASRQKKFLVVAVDYFSKWVEAEPLAKITEDNIMDFMWNFIVSQYGWPRDLVSDNGTQFHGKRIRSWLAGIKVTHHFTSVAHPQANGHVEVTNRTLVRGLKARLERAGGGWVDELQSVL
ncbi:hypothetical protein DH2020_022004 [Rehmannia glutinosa]|uniref:Integrase catalytic domain-containing protein n=1 Tax=Rehmannia glutinosa TaxID=99300 RepID=A0ABR0WFS6_REHGL